MAEHPNAVLARQMTDALSRGDMQALEGFLADDVIWHEIGHSEPRRGKAALRASAAAAARSTTRSRVRCTMSSPTTTTPSRWLMPRPPAAARR